MAALIYLGRKTLKNIFLQWLKKPGIVILYAVIIGAVLFSFATSSRAGMAGNAIASGYLPAALLVAFFIMLYVAVRGALTNGTTVFSLEDVQLLFPSPVSPQVILLYGVVRQCAVSLTLLFVIVCQTASLQNVFGMNGKGIAALVVGWFVATVVSQVVALSLYALLAERPTAKRVALWITNGSAIAMVLLGGIALLRNPTLPALADVFSHSAWKAFPLAGWAVASVGAAQGGQMAYAALWLLPSLALGCAVFALLWKANPDYYEDVLSLSQERFEMRQRVQSQGKAGMEGFSRRRVRIGKVGLTAGRGPSAFFFKHMIEMRREGWLFIDQKTLVSALAVGLAAFSMRTTIDDPAFVLSIALIIVVYLQMILTVLSGRFVQETLRPFLFLAPGSARAKLLFANLQPALKAGLDAALCFGIASALIEFDLLVVLFSGAVVALMHLIFTGGTLLTEWILGKAQAKMLSTMLYFLLEMVLLVPGFVLFFIVMQWSMVLAYCALLGYAAIVAALVFAILGGLLHSLDV